MPASHRGSGYVNLQTYLGLNQGIARGMGDTLADDLEQKGQSATSGLQTTQQDFHNALGKEGSPTSLSGTQGWGDLAKRAMETQTQARALEGMGGTAALLEKQYGPTTWGGGMLDAALVRGGSAGNRIANASGAYGKLVNRLNEGNDASIKESANYKPPAAATPAPVEPEDTPELPQYKQDQLDKYGVRPTKPAKRPRTLTPGDPTTRRSI